MVLSLRRFAACLFLCAGAPAMIGTNDMHGQFEERVLAAHNRERNALGIAPLRWNPELAVAARGWADHLARTGAFEHAPEQEEPQGENLWAGTRGRYALEAMVDGWVREKRHYRHGLFPNNSDTGRVEDVGHYTQLMWRSSTHVGCAVTANPREEFLVCRYSEGGNVIGEQPF